MMISTVTVAYHKDFRKKKKLKKIQQYSNTLLTLMQVYLCKIIEPIKIRSHTPRNPIAKSTNMEIKGQIMAQQRSHMIIE